MASVQQTVFLFPGQGSQSLGMMADLAEDCPEVRDTFDEASGVLDLDLWSLCQAGPEAELNRTENTQPAMLAGDMAPAMRKGVMMRACRARA